MRRRILTAIILFELLFLGGCEPPCPTCPNQPGQPCPVQIIRPVDLPLEMRTENYAGGSCLHAAWADCLQVVGLEDWAAWWTTAHAGGYSVDQMWMQADEYGLRIAYTVDGNEELLEWCSRTRRWAAIHYKPVHAIAFCGFVTDDSGRQHAVLLDNNSVGEYEYVPKEQFLRGWQGYGGRAIVPVYAPHIPVPWA